MNTKLIRGIALLIAMLLIGIGCKKEPEKYHISGTIKYKGELVPAGNIVFDPVGDGTAGSATIYNGRFDTSKEGAAVLPGPHRIRISGFDGKTANEAPLGQPLFPEYTFEKELPKESSTLEIEVPVPKVKK